MSLASRRKGDVMEVKTTLLMYRLPKASVKPLFQAAVALAMDPVGTERRLAACAHIQLTHGVSVSEFLHATRRQLTMEGKASRLVHSE
jgi:hypothetical protein